MAAEYPRDRLSLRAYVRARLRGSGLLEFADDDAQACSSAEVLYLNCGPSWHEDAISRKNLELEGLIATTTDVPMQRIENTIQDDDEFWSSTGTSTGAAGEALLYRLRQPLSRPAYVSVAVYRAQYQHGDPMYPARKISFLTGPTPNQLYPASPVFPVRLTDEVQMFALSPTAAVSSFLMVRLHGRLQRQWQDLQFYIAIRHVASYGDPVSASYGHQLARLTLVNGLAWPCSRGLLSAEAASAWGDQYGNGRAADHATTSAIMVSHSGGGGNAADTPGGVQPALPAPPASPLRHGVVAEDVFEVMPQSSAKCRKTYVTVALRRKPRRVSSGVEAVGSVDPEPEALTASALARSRPPRPCCVLPSGPTDSELRQLVQQTAVLRALPLLVHVAWPALLLSSLDGRASAAAIQITDTKLQPLGSGRRCRGAFAESSARMQKPHLKPQLGSWRASGSAAVVEAPPGDAAAAGWGRSSVQAATSFTASPAAPAPVGHGVSFPMETRLPPGVGALQRLREGVVAAARGTVAAVAHSGTDTDSDSPDGVRVEGDGGFGWDDTVAGGSRLVPAAVAAMDELPSGSGAAAGQVCVPAESLAARSNAHLHPLIREEGSGDCRGWLRIPRERARDGAQGAVAAGEHSGSATSQDPTAATAAVADVGMDADHIHALVLSYLGTHHLTMAPNANADWPERRRQLEGLQLLIQQQLQRLQQRQQRHRQQLEHLRHVPQDRRSIWVAGAGSGRVGLGAAAAAAAPVVRHLRPQQPLPPPKLRRRGEVGPMYVEDWLRTRVKSGAFGTACGLEGGGREDARRRWRRHVRGVQRTMQPALYDPSRSTALFVMLETWTGYGDGSSSSNCRKSAAAEAAAAGELIVGDKSAVSWRVSHYDHEHM